VPVIEFAYTKYRDMMVPMIPIKIECTAEIGFSERLGVGFNLLGRKNIFDLFKVCFSDREEKVTFQKL